DYIRACFIAQRQTIPGRFPAVPRDLASPPDSASREHDGFGAKNFESPALAFVTKCTNHTIAIFEERENGVLHINLDPLTHSVVLQRPNHLQTTPISTVRESRIFMTTKVPLQNTTIFCSIEDC